MYDRARVCIVRMHEKSLTVLEEVLLSGGADIQVLMTAMPLQQHLIFECLCLSAALCVCVCVCVCGSLTMSSSAIIVSLNACVFTGLAANLYSGMGIY